VSVYQGEDFLEGCLRNLVEQTLFARGELRVVVIDAHSAGQEKQITQSFRRAYPQRILYRRLWRRRSLYYAWNLGIRMTSSPYLTSANVDDRHRPDALERMVEVLEAKDDLDGVYADQKITECPHETFAENSATERWGWPDYDPAILRRRCILGPQPVWRRSLHDRFGPFDASFASAGDWEFWLRCSGDARFHRIPEVLGLYYRNPRGLEAANPRAEAEDREIRRRYGLFHEPPEPTLPVPL
jgi:glycosyltransferase involved in cell wall biosynthesis